MAQQYDTEPNKTRDLEAQALRAMLSSFTFASCLEIGCGTGKNTDWLLTKAQHVTAVDLSESMLAKAREKISSERVTFIQADINQDWNFVQRSYDLAIFSLVLEHIEDLESVFEKMQPFLTSRGYIYIGELHSFKQYTGSKARFETEQGHQIVPGFNHHISDFINAAKKQEFRLLKLEEHFDGNDRAAIPRILSCLFERCPESERMTAHPAMRDES